MIRKLLSTRNLFAIYLGSIVLLMTLPLNSGSGLNNIFVLHIRGDYLLHAGLFLPWSFFRFRSQPTLISWFLWGMFFASASEGIQYLLPYRAFNVNDLLANAFGVFLSISFWWAVGKKNNKSIK